MKSKRNKLQLSKETLRSLRDEQLEGAAGARGVTYVQCRPFTDGCSTWTCGPATGLSCDIC